MKNSAAVSTASTASTAKFSLSGIGVLVVFVAILGMAGWQALETATTYWPHALSVCTLAGAIIVTAFACYTMIEFEITSPYWLVGSFLFALYGFTTIALGYTAWQCGVNLEEVSKMYLQFAESIFVACVMALAAFVGTFLAFVFFAYAMGEIVGATIVRARHGS